MSMCGGVDKQKGVYTDNGLSFSLQKEGNSDTRYNIEDTKLRESGRSQNDKYYMILFL